MNFKRTNSPTIQHGREPVDLERLWHIWNVNGPDLSLSCEICSFLREKELFYELDFFLRNLPREEEYLVNETLNRARVKVAFWKEDFESVYNIIQNNYFSDAADLVELWDLCHYKEEESRRQKPLTPLMRFRVRQRFMPPVSILPSGRRKKATFSQESKDKLRKWLNANKDYPYPNRKTKIELSEQTSLTVFQVSTWFANARRRIYREMKMRKEFNHRKEKEVSKPSDVKVRQGKQPNSGIVHSSDFYPHLDHMASTPPFIGSSATFYHPNCQHSCHDPGFNVHNETGIALFNKADQSLPKPFPYAEEYLRNEIHVPRDYFRSSTHTIASSVGQHASVESQGLESTNQDAAQILVDLSSKVYK